MEVGSTKYRKINNGYWNYLQYLSITERNFLGIKWRNEEWKYVPTNNYHEIYGRYDESRDYKNDLKHNIDKFVCDNPDIIPYLLKTEAEINAKKEKQRLKYLKIEQKRNTTEDIICKQ